MLKKNIAIFGSTGSVGTQCIEVIKKLNLNIFALVANENVTLLEKQIIEFKPKKVYLKNKEKEKYLQKKYPNIIFETPLQIAKSKNCNFVISAISGREEINATLEALRQNKIVALAQKEVLVEKGKEVLDILKNGKGKILPLDSEHSAIFQCLENNKKKDIEKIILTCSGGPFFGKNKNFLKTVKAKDAIKHPKWNMGKKISIDSSTLMNKALEIIEAVYLFDISYKKIKVVIHPEAKIHSGVQFVDGNLSFFAATTDMKIPIFYALTYPNRTKNNFKRINFDKPQNWSFFAPDTKTFPSLDLAKKALEIGNNACTNLNKANNKAVSLFLENKISFLEIFEICKKSLKK